MKTDRSVASRRARPVFAESPYVAPRYHSSIWSRLIFALLILALVGGVVVVGGFYWAFQRPQGGSAARVTFHVAPGESVAAIANHLQSQGLIDNATFFRIDARLRGLGGALKVGDYTLRRNMSIDQMVTALKGTPVIHLVQVTIPEGWRLEQIAELLGQKGLDAKGFLREAKHPDLSPSFYPILRDKPPQRSLEGYLFPNTYDVRKDSSGKSIAAFLVGELQQKFTPAMIATARRHGFSVYQVLTLASIVEREARVANERPLIASVYENRLKPGGGDALFADPTVQYAIGRPGKWWPVLTDSPRNIVPNSPYNTYTHNGLPPGPIANPGLASIQAVLTPRQTNYLYFVAKGHGEHAFESTLAQHNADVCTYEHVGC